jgi:hypothetical protein
MDVVPYHQDPSVPMLAIVNVSDRAVVAELTLSYERIGNEEGSNVPILLGCLLPGERRLYDLDPQDWAQARLLDGDDHVAPPINPAAIWDARRLSREVAVSTYTDVERMIGVQRRYLEQLASVLMQQLTAPISRIAARLLRGSPEPRVSRWRRLIRWLIRGGGDG